MDRSNSSDFAEAKVKEAREAFYRRVGEALAEWARDIGAAPVADGEQGYAEHIPKAPLLFRLLEALALEAEVSTEGKAQIAVVLSYFSAPQDEVPEAVVGPSGYVDDVALAALTVKEIADRAGTDVVRRCWPEEEDPGPVIDEVLRFARYAMGTETWRRVRAEFRRQVGVGGTKADRRSASEGDPDRS